jgi:hypothetical protein
MTTMTELLTSLYLTERQGVPLLVSKTDQGFPHELQLPVVPLQVAYVPQGLAGTQEGLAQARSRLAGSPADLLFLPSACPDGPPNRSGVIFRRNGKRELPWERKGHAKMTEFDEYLVCLSNGGYSWSPDLAAGRPGYFVTGGATHAELWRISRGEQDIIGREVFTMAPVRLANGLPNADFSLINDTLLQQKLISDWTELQQSLAAHSPAALVTAASKIAESLLAYGLDLPTSGKKSMNLASGLKDLKQLLESKATVPKLLFTDLDYHLMSKIRILHGHTHADRVVINGRLIKPEMALTVATDIAEVLTNIGLAPR